MHKMRSCGREVAYLGEIDVLHFLLRFRVTHHFWKDQHQQKRQEHHKDHRAEEEVGNLEWMCQKQNIITPTEVCLNFIKGWKLVAKTLGAILQATPGTES